MNGKKRDQEEGRAFGRGEVFTEKYMMNVSKKDLGYLSHFPGIQTCH